MVNRSRIRICFRFADGCSGSSSGKNDTTVSSMLSFPSATASPTAVEVKLLLSDQRTCGVSGDSGSHHASATTCPWRSSMKLCIESTFRSAASMNARIACEETPCDSGVARGSPFSLPVAAAAANARQAARLQKATKRVEKSQHIDGAALFQALRPTRNEPVRRLDSNGHHRAIGWSQEGRLTPPLVPGVRWRSPASVSPAPTSDSPVPASVSPVPASVSPVPASVSPVPASVSPVPASVSPVPASVSPVIVEIVRDQWAFPLHELGHPNHDLLEHYLTPLQFPDRTWNEIYASYCSATERKEIRGRNCGKKGMVCTSSAASSRGQGESPSVLSRQSAIVLAQ